MPDRGVTVNAKTDDEAVVAAARALDTETSNVKVKSAGRNKFKAWPVNADAYVKIEISKDASLAKVDEVLPPAGQGGWPSAEALTTSFRNQGVAEPDAEAAAELAGKLEAGEDVRGFVVAEERQAVEPEDARVDYGGDPERPVFRGDLLGRKVPAVHPRPGRKVTGEEVPPREDREPEDLTVSDKHFEFDPESGTIHAKGPGRPVVKDGVLGLKPLFKVSEDRLSIRAKVFARDFHGRKIDVGKYKHVLSLMGVQAEVDEALLASAIREAEESGGLVEDVIVAVGSPPVEGEDARFEPAVESKEKPSMDSSGRVNHRECCAFVSVREGELIGRYVPPVFGKKGLDVFGKDIDPKDVSALQIKAGEGVSVSANGLEYTASTTGLVSWQGDTLSVLDVLDVPGDVDYSTGNLRLEKGSVRIKGSIRDGFEVHAPGGVLVGGSIESARVSTKGDVRVTGGILTGESGGVVAGGDISAAFAENSRLKSGGDVLVAQNVTNCEIAAKGRLKCTSGKGLIQGGNIRAEEGVEANEVGSEYGVRTEFHLGSGKCERQERLYQERREHKERLSKITGSLGGGDPRQILARAPENKRVQIAKLLKTRLDSERRLKEIEQELANAHEEFMESCARARLRVRIKAWPGAVVSILGSSLEIHEPTDAPTIGFNPSSKQVEIL
jgi:uncharacterized protein (DUF342 family)